MPHHIVTPTALRRRPLVFLLCVCVILFVQWQFLSVKIVELPWPVYQQQAIDLQPSAGWSYGFVRGHHGARLVRARIAAGSPPATFTDVDRLQVDATLRSRMQHELDRVAAEATLEALLYVALLVLVFAPAAWILPRHYRDRDSVLCVSLQGAVKGAMLGTVALLPLALARYGEPLYTNWVGPGAVSYSGPYLGPSPGTGFTVSYRFFVEVFALWPYVIARSARGTADAIRSVPPPLMLWLTTAAYYGALGACWAVGSAPAKGRATRLDVSRTTAGSRSGRP